MFLFNPHLPSHMLRYLLLLYGRAYGPDSVKWSRLVVRPPSISRIVNTLVMSTLRLTASPSVPPPLLPTRTFPLPPTPTALVPEVVPAQVEFHVFFLCCLFSALVTIFATVWLLMTKSRLVVPTAATSLSPRQDLDCSLHSEETVYEDAEDFMVEPLHALDIGQEAPEQDADPDNVDSQLEGDQTNAELPDTSHSHDMKDTEVITKNTQVNTTNTQVATRNTQVTTKNTQVTTKNTQVATKATQVTTKATQVATKNMSVPTKNTQITTKAPSEVRRRCLEIVVDDPSPLHPDDLVPTKQVGVGGFGRVYEVKDKVTGAVMAVKRISRDKGLFGEVLLWDEICALHLMDDNPAFPSLYGAFMEEQDFLLVMPYYPRGDLHNFIKKSGGYLTHRLARFYGAELLLAIHCLHQNGIIHRDIKPANVLIDDRGHLVVTDFGVAKVFRQREKAVPELDEEWRRRKLQGGDSFPLLWPDENPDTTIDIAGTVIYAAPEVFANQPYSYGVDYWSMGVIIHEMITGYPPYPHFWEDDEEFFPEPLVLDLRARCYQGQVLDNAERTFLGKLFAEVPHHRPSVRQMKQDEFWSEIEWDLMRNIPVPPQGLAPR